MVMLFLLAINIPVNSSVKISAHSFALTVQLTNTMLVLHLLTHSLLLRHNDYLSWLLYEVATLSLLPCHYPLLRCWQQWQPRPVCWQDIMGLCGLVSCCDLQRLLEARFEDLIFFINMYLIVLIMNRSK